MKTYEGSLVGTGLKIAVVVGRFNEFINERLLDGAVSALKRHGVDENDIEVVWVPGAYEIPLATKNLQKRINMMHSLRLAPSFVARHRTSSM